MSKFIPYVGGKTYLADTILKMFPKHNTYVEPFVGAGGILFSKMPSKIEVINDINRDLITLYRVVKHHKDEFLKQFEHILVSRAEFETYKMTPPEVLTDIQRAIRFFYMQKLAFGGKVVGQSFGTSKTSPPKLNIQKIEETLFEVHYRLVRVVIECLPYAEVFKIYDSTDTFFYIDPPYYGTEKYYGKDVFYKADFTTLSEILKEVKGKFLLSINDCPEIREIFKEFAVVTKDVKYTVGTDNNHTAGELIYKNF